MSPPRPVNPAQIRPHGRRGACPALAAPMETGDGLLARLVPQGGALTLPQARGLAEAARAFGNGILEVSARGSLQIRGLSAATTGPLNDRVAMLGIVPRVGLALDISPLAGLDGAEHADARPLAAAILKAVAARGLAGRLGPKVCVVVEGGGAVPLAGLKADVRIWPADGGGAAQSEPSLSCGPASSERVATPGHARLHSAAQRSAPMRALPDPAPLHSEQWTSGSANGPCHSTRAGEAVSGGLAGRGADQGTHHDTAGNGSPLSASASRDVPRLWAVGLAGDAASALPFRVVAEEEAPELVARLLAAVAGLGPAARMADALAAGIVTPGAPHAHRVDAIGPAETAPNEPASETAGARPGSTGVSQGTPAAPPPESRPRPGPPGEPAPAETSRGRDPARAFEAANHEEPFARSTAAPNPQMGRGRDPARSPEAARHGEPPSGSPAGRSPGARAADPLAYSGAARPDPAGAPRPQALPASRPACEAPAGAHPSHAPRGPVPPASAGRHVADHAIGLPSDQSEAAAPALATAAEKAAPLSPNGLPLADHAIGSPSGRSGPEPPATGEIAPSPAGLRPAAPPPDRVASAPVRIPLADGTLALAVGLAFGQCEAQALAALATAAEEAGARDMRPAPGHRLFLAGLSQDGADRLARAAATLGFLTEAGDPRAFVSACPGAPACASALFPARAFAPRVVEALAPLLDGSVHVHISGCGKGCAHPAPAAITLVGTKVPAGDRERAKMDLGGMDFALALVRDGKARDAEPGNLSPDDALARLSMLAAQVAADRLCGESAQDALARLSPSAQPDEKTLEPPAP